MNGQLKNEWADTRGAETAFAEKHLFLTWAYELTKNRRKAWHFFIWCLFLF
jgi:hypothetical protein